MVSKWVDDNRDAESSKRADQSNPTTPCSSSHINSSHCMLRNINHHAPPNHLSCYVMGRRRSYVPSIFDTDHKMIIHTITINSSHHHSVPIVRIVARYPSRHSISLHPSSASLLGIHIVTASLCTDRPHRRLVSISSYHLSASIVRIVARYPSRHIITLYPVAQVSISSYHNSVTSRLGINIVISSIRTHRSSLLLPIHLVTSFRNRSLSCLLTTSMIPIWKVCL